MSDTEEEPDEPKKKKRISVQAGKAKARNLQKWVCDLILKECPSLEPDDVKSTSMGAQGEDVQLSPAARKQLPISIECKAYSSFAFYKFLDQAEANCPKGCEPVVVCKANHRHPVVVVDAAWFFKQFPKRIRR